MSFEVKVEGMNKGQTQKGKPKTGIYDGKKWWNVFGHYDDIDRGKTVSLKPTQYKDWYDFEFVVEPRPAQPEQPDATGNGSTKISWSEYESLVRKVHSLAMELEPDAIDEKDNDSVAVDRSPARHSIVNTILMQYTKGAFEYPEIPF